MIEIQRNETSYPITYDNVINAYTKGSMYCILFEKDGKRVTHKYPLCSIFRVIEDYNGTSDTSKSVKTGDPDPGPHFG